MFSFYIDILIGNISLIRNLIAYGLPIIGTVLFTPILKILISPWVCNYDAGPGTTNTHQYLVDGTTYICYQPTHIAILVCAILSFIIYFPTAVRFYPAWQQLQTNLDIHYKSNYLIIAAVLKFSMVVVNAFALNSAVYLTFSLIFVVTHFLFLLIRRPANIPEINGIKLVSIGAVLWSGICALVAVIIDNPDNYTGAYMLYAGWSALFLLTIYFIRKLKFEKSGISESQQRITQLREITKQSSKRSLQSLQPEEEIYRKDIQNSTDGL